MNIKTLFRIFLALAGLGLLAAGCGKPAAPANPDIILATTTSTQDSGLLDVLIPLFHEKTGYRVKTIAVGTGQALKMGERGEADVLLVHAPDLEQKYMAEGHAKDRFIVMHNDFILIGPPEDKAGVKSAPDIGQALRRIYQAEGPFISRGDNSGTDNLEKKLWRDLGLKPEGWYLQTGQGMGATLTIASEKGAYTISDRATFLALKGRLQLVIVKDGDAPLLNIYHVITVNPAKSAKINYAGARAFAGFMVAPATQEIIGEFGIDKFGQPLFFPDAGK